MTTAPAPTAPESSTDVPILYGQVEGVDARTLAAQVRSVGPVLHIASDDVRLDTLARLIEFFDPTIRILRFPGWDCLPYDRVSPSPDVTAARLSTLAALDALDETTPTLILTTLSAATTRVLPRTALHTRTFACQVGMSFPDGTIAEFLTLNGYARTDTVRESGEYAVRGNIIDIFPTGFDRPIRFDFFGPDLETLRFFDPATQRSEEKIDKVTLLPATEYALDPGSIACFRTGYRDAFGVPLADDPLYTAISDGRRHAGAEHWLPLFYPTLATLFDYLPASTHITLDPQLDHVAQERFDQIGDYYSARQSFLRAEKERKAKSTTPLYLPLSPDRLYLNSDEWNHAFRAYPTTAWSVFKNPQDDHDPHSATRARDFSDIRANPKSDVFEALRDHLDALRKAVPTRITAIACYSTGSRDRMRTMMESAGFQKLARCENAKELALLHPAQTALIVLPLEHGFTAPDLAVLTEQDILGDRLVRRTHKKRKSDHFINDIGALNPGDLVVHVDHGVGRFDGLETIAAAGTVHDCLKIIYDGGDRLFLPVENMELLSRFGADADGTTPLDKLGGSGWQARKARVKKDLMIMAGELLDIAAARLLRGAETFNTDATSHYAQFVARFPYAETEDQQNAIDDVLADLARGTPADRLVCGDVGFGKTEIALRAAYVVAASGAQVAVVVPTTLLARQHTQNFVRRFEGLGIRVAQLSRMVNAKDAKMVKDGLADGSVQIVIGTHALLAKDIRFAHLGLMIVDEEQRFGVKQKEALKALKHNVHVVTLTATPIPRTLQMALSGVRDMSIIASPPVDRLAIRTAVLPYDAMVIREAILRERHRGGQTFYVCPRIADLDDVAERLRDLVPEIRVVIAHGQLTPSELEARMTAFYDGQYDILLATNIIESGIDIPSANTLIVHRADMFGLAQLYQIRGRIGRAKVRAYAYLTYDGHAHLNPTAQKRLEVIEMLDTLGSGFQLASHDMDIRGAGNLLGDDQSGHVREVGVELYQHMLEEAVAAARLRAEDPARDSLAITDDTWTPTINLATSILIPETYIENLNVRMGLYRRLSDLETKSDIDSFAAEMIDRFGRLPDEVNNLFDIIEMKQLCRTAGIDKVDAGPKGAVIGFRNDHPPKPDALFAWIAGKKGTVKVRPDQKLVLPREWHDLAHRVSGVRAVLKELAGL